MGNDGSWGLTFYIIRMPLRSLHSFCSVPSHLLKSVERQILRIWEQREAFTPYYSLRSKIDDSTLYYIWEQREYHHMEGTEEAWNMNMSMGGSKPHACMHACNMQHSHVQWTHATLTHPCGTQHTMQHTRSCSSAQPTPYIMKDCTFRDLNIDQGIINAQK